MATKKPVQPKEDIFENPPVTPVDEEKTLENETDPEIVTEQPAPKRRGRPPGSKNGAKSEGPQKTASRQRKDTDELAHQIVGLHALAAMATGLQELIISETEGAMLAGGINAVAQEYGLSFSGKTGAAIQLFGALGMVYVPRLIMIKQRMEMERQKAEHDKPLDGFIHDPNIPEAGFPDVASSH